uniref:Uncharacterized protein n=1 Tax=Chaetoceros debilis TaxID=122233 RepID=A0A7S3Q8B9_9STRA
MGCKMNIRHHWILIPLFSSNISKDGPSIPFKELMSSRNISGHHLVPSITCQDAHHRKLLQCTIGMMNVMSTYCTSKYKTRFCRGFCPCFTFGPFGSFALAGPDLD